MPTNEAGTETDHPSDYMAPLDGLRGLGCLLVVAAHIMAIAYPALKSGLMLGGLGVVIFFALSGFLMSALYCSEKFDLHNAVHYAIARFTRIAPAYWIAVILAWLIYLFIPDFHYQMNPVMFIRSLLFAGNQGVFWSIPPEVQFYGFFLLLWFSWQKYQKGHYLWPIISILVSVFFLASSTFWGGLMLPSKLDIFLAGFLAAFLLKIPNVKNFICAVPFQVVIIASSTIYAAKLVHENVIYTDIIFPVLVALMLASVSHSSIVTKLLETRTMRLMGAASFSIYLFHDMLLLVGVRAGIFGRLPAAIDIAVMSLIALALPTAFHFMVEKPLNKFSKAKALEHFQNFKAARTKTLR